MRPLAERQTGFAAALLDPGAPAPHGLVGPDGLPSARRFGIYRNNVLAGLSDVLKAAYPATCRIVGEDFFAAMARLYVLAEPPRSPRLIEYGAGFPDFIARFEPAAALPYLAD
ncbi:MAG TPA: DNA-binding domain-containing protein, partial [Arenibaculum sp.]|nr:DNA-binding domain-containing protein [Arenibaculum sp.]